MNENEDFKRILRLCLLILLVFAFIGFAERLRQNLQPNDSSAIFGGRLESGYDYAGYMVADKGNGNVEICGTVIINETTAITAAHCVDDNTAIYIGLGSFSANPKDYYAIEKVEIHPSWANGNGISSDIAVLTLIDPIFLTTYAEISTGNIGCDYTIVGYGKQDNTEDYKPLRKSADLCIDSTNFNDGSISFTGGDGGLCFGDSGSPVFKSGTNQFVTIASRIDACYTKNFGTGADLSEQISNLNIQFNSVAIDNPSDRICGSIDSDSNGLLNSKDLASFISLYGERCDDKVTSYKCGNKDVDLDGDIDVVDLSNFAKKYRVGKCSTSL